MLGYFKQFEVVRHGDAEGNGMVLRLTTLHDEEMHAIAVPQDSGSHTGPTWAYLFECGALTLIDPGSTGSFDTLLESIKCAGYAVRDVERVIITHGHADHDGSVAQLVGECGAELWAHDIYAYLLPYDPRDIQLRPTSPIKEEMIRVAAARQVGPPSSAIRDGYLAGRRRLEVKHRIQANENDGDLTFLHTPGHSPDEVCVVFDGLVFTGDHVLPEISPHPTMRTRFTTEVKQSLPVEYRDENRWFGLATYLRSLRPIVDLGPDVGVMPAHRLFNKGAFNFDSSLRAGEIIQHHASRLGHILEAIGGQPTSLESITQRIFERRKLAGLNLFAALTEVVAHIEFLQEAGDLELTEEHLLQRTRTENYYQVIQEITG
jgi:glyoxylase-like metal-dependent hydrolase (beta-lactamase superfamily II)